MSTERFSSTFWRDILEWYVESQVFDAWNKRNAFSSEWVEFNAPLDTIQVISEAKTRSRTLWLKVLVNSASEMTYIVSGGALNSTNST